MHTVSPGPIWMSSPSSNVVIPSTPEMVSSKASWLCATGIPAPWRTSQRDTVTLPFEAPASTETVTVMGPRWIGSESADGMGLLRV
jgi:hypothetical protein